MIDMWSSPTSEAFDARRWDVGIFGQTHDDRGTAAVGFVRSVVDSHIEVTYDPESFRLSLNGKTVDADDAPSALDHVLNANVLIESATLGFAEMFLLYRAARSIGASGTSFLYVEPSQYSRPRHSHLLHRRDFELSEEVQHFGAIPGAAVMARSDRVTKGVFLLGYEGHRLEQALEQTELHPRQTSVLIGVPAFQTGWEMDALANNVRILREQQIAGDILFAGADNPKAAFEAIQRVYASCGPDDRLVIGPIGTKPHGIGAAIFACNHPDVGLIYDHPIRRSGRSRETGRWHLFDVSF